MRAAPNGLCDSCRWKRAVPATRSTFVLCTRGLSDPAYPKYPVVPVMTCRGYEADVDGAPPREAPR